MFAVRDITYVCADCVLPNVRKTANTARPSCTSVQITRYKGLVYKQITTKMSLVLASVVYWGMLPLLILTQIRSLCIKHNQQPRTRCEGLKCMSLFRLARGGWGGHRSQDVPGEASARAGADDEPGLHRCIIMSTIPYRTVPQGTVR